MLTVVTIFNTGGLLIFNLVALLKDMHGHIYFFFIKKDMSHLLRLSKFGTVFFP